MIDFILINSAILIALYLIIILISFDPSDPSWLQTEWNGSIHNIGGTIGACCSDFLFFMFGILAYIIPLFIFLYLWRIYVQQVHFTIFIILFELIGSLALLFVCCGFLNLINDNFFYFSSGGIIGCVLCGWIFSYNNFIYNIILFLFLIVIISTTFFFNRYFIAKTKIIKERLINSFNILKQRYLKKKQFKCQYFHDKLYTRTRVYPTIFCDKTSNCLQNVTKKSLKEKFYDTSLNVNVVSKTLNFNVENNLFVKTCHEVPSTLKIDDKLLQYQFKYLDIYSNRINHNNRKENCVQINSLVKKNSFNTFNKYHKNLRKNSVLHVLQDKGSNKNNSLSAINYSSNNVFQQSESINKNKNQYSFIAKKVNVLGAHCNSNYNIKNVVLPDINLLMRSITDNTVNTLELKHISQLLEKKLAEYHVLTNVVNVVSGPMVTRFELNLSPGMKSSKIVNLSRDLARSLSVTSVRVVEVIPGTPYVGLEVPNKKRRIVCLRDIISSEQFQKINTPLALALGKDISGNPIVEDLRRMPHLLVAGTTGSGKSVGINAMIISILYKAKPDEVRFIMIDPKILELSIYSSIPHILKQVITDVHDVDKILQWCIQEMESRYQLMAKIGVRNLENYNCYIEKLHSEKCVVDSFTNNFTKSMMTHFEKKLQKLPYIVIIVDEFSDLIITSAKKIEELIIRLTQKARAAGIHLILATQRPSVDIITGLIKANIPARMAFTVSSKIDSHTIIGQSGAESLLGMGDMLYLAPNSSIPIRVHGAYIRDQEVHAVVNFWKS